MARLTHNLEYLGALTGVKLARLLSARHAHTFGTGLGILAHALLPSRRRIAYDNLRQAFGDSLSRQEIKIIIKRVFQNLGCTLVEFARFGKIKLEDVRRIVIADGLENLRKVHDEGKGAIVLTAHFGNWELLGCWLAAVGFPVDFLVGTQHNQKVDDLLNNFRRAMGVGIIPLKTSIRGVFKCLKENRLAGIVADQHAHSGGVAVEFFGRLAATPKGPAVFAIRAGCPLVPLLLRRERYDRHVVMACQPIYPPNSGDEERDIKTMTIACTKFFEDGIRKYPDQWMWTHRRWKL